VNRPRIGITTSYEDGRQMLDHHYVRAIEAAGGLPLIVPVLETADAVAAFAALLDGVVITGGPAITTNLIGDLPADLPPTDPARVASDTAVFNAVADKPVLGICYGMQFINAQAGGSIYADAQALRPGTLPHSAGRGGQPHPVQFAEGSHLRAVFGVPDLVVNTYHIQAVAEVGAGLRAVGYGPDGVIEAIESEDGRLVGVQFHPERMVEQTHPLFEEFVRRAAQHQTERA
jgi:putative glutamine amidotransferase